MTTARIKQVLEEIDRARNLILGRLLRFTEKNIEDFIARGNDV